MFFLYDISLTNTTKYIWEKFLSVSGYNSLTTDSLIIAILLPIACLITELIIVGWEKSSLKIIVSNYSIIKGDIECWLINFLKLFEIYSILLTFGLCYYLAGVIQKNFQLNLIVNIKNVYTQFIIVFLVSDLKNYVSHWVFHKISFLWEIHKYHHSAEKFTMFSSIRGHGVEYALRKFFDVIPFIILGTPLQSFALIIFLREAHQYFIHSNIKSDWGIIGKYILVSPNAHWLHHSTNQKHYNKNIGNTFIFWDRLFGTYHAPEENIKIGIDNNHLTQYGFIKGNLITYKEAIKSFRVFLFNYKNILLNRFKNEN